MQIRLFILSLLTFTATYKTYSSPTYSFNQISISDGLLESYISCVTKDHNGDIWIGNHEGLNCYDGYQVKTYNFCPFDKETLPSDEIYFVTEDKQKTLWIGTSRGLATFDRTTQKFKRKRFKNKPIISHTSISLKNKIIFPITTSHLFEYNYKTNSLAKIHLSKDKLKNTQLSELQKLEDNIILANSRWNGIYTLNLKTKTIKKVNLNINNKTPALFVDSHSQIWVSDSNKGVRCYNKNWKLLHHFSSKNSPLTHDIILDFEEHNNHIWLATDGGGINIISLKDFSFSSIQKDSNNSSSLPCLSFRCLYNDIDNNMWLGSIRSGLIKVSKTYSEVFYNVPFGNKKGLSNQTVVSLFEDKNSKIWVGTDGGGINLFDPIKKTFKHYKTTQNKKVTSICSFNKDELLISTFAHGVFRFNKNNGKLTPFTILNRRISNLNTHLGQSISLSNYDKDRIILNGSHMYLFDIRTNKFTILASQNIDYHYKNLTKVTEDSAKIYYVSRVELIELDRSSQSTRCIFTTKQPEMINDACIDSKGYFWLAKNSGLVCFDPKKNKIIKKIKSLSFGVNTILCDKNDRLWIGAKNMIYLYDIKLNNLRILNDTYNTPLNEYIAQSKLISKSGEIYMGGVLGLLKINKDIHFPAINSNTLGISSLQLNGKNITKKQIINKKKLSIPWNFTALSIKLKVKGNIFHKNQFRYMIEGINKNFIETFDHNIEIYTLPIGRFNLIGSYKSSNGEWTQQKKLLEIVITPPWWKTNTFYGLLILIIITITSIIHLNIKKRRIQKQQLEINQIKEEYYEEKVDFFINISHELRTPLTLIYAPLQRYFASNNNHILNKKDIESIYKQVQNMMNIINTLLDIRSLEVQKNMSTITSCKLNQWVESKVNEFSNELKEREIDLVFNFDTTIKSTPFDTNKCGIILSNLIMNALKFSHENTTIKVSTKRDNGFVRVSVKDQGIGINESEITELFSSYYQGTHGIKGNGIGLSYSQMLVKQLGGKINAYQNKDTEGSTFYFEIPDTLVVNTNPSMDKSSNIPIHHNELDIEINTKEYSIIIIEDNKDLQEMVSDHLNPLFKNVYTANNGKKGLEDIYKYQPDIIISDIMMPKMNGFDLCKAVKNDFKISHIPIILLTAYNNPNNTLNGYKLGANAYVPKPFQFDLLMSVITTQIRNREIVKSRYKDLGITTVTIEESTISSIDEDFLSKFIKLIEDNLDNPHLDLKLITQKMYMSRSSISNKVKSLMGLSIMEYVIQARIKKAIHLLIHSSKSITEISTEVGFSSSRYFSTVFKEKQGATPTNYRKDKITEDTKTAS
ncbi:response regulator [Halosquirtibacter xylanolyticus]|uniref:hybrid sensor histidine kinase/response regulator transcription factor n=1 Tax=Halosquirtibacter xylanolyticus TaxID=3374599 RepID=UPI0037484A5C|nr:response regulator [Prolixibacteraceae bacterium]